ncbi:hypothetical protein Vafri_4195 [Volvox africanus]|uniref:SUF system FeS cluster assembly SufBD core domain-containing protein n=1 Tax=Volvox africanus TaxID=51714 RepID=A0A8J4AUJ2_9CHLO|nr:hypothetical protein Vafri_4195 [Volvox africanus]
MQTSVGNSLRTKATGHRTGSCKMLKSVFKACKNAALASASASQLAPEDKWLARTVKEVAVPPSLVSLRETSNGALATLRMPTTRNEDYRFTDISPLLRTAVEPAAPGAQVPSEVLERTDLPDAAVVAVIVDGVLRHELSRGLVGLPKGVYVGPLDGAPASTIEKLGSLSNARGGPFAVLNGSLTPGALVVALGPGASLPGPVFVLHVASASHSGADGAAAPANAPRMLVHAGAGSLAEVVEEYVSLAGSSSAISTDSARYLTVSVAEVFLEPDAEVKHSYVQRESADSFHFKGTLVHQAERSRYTVTEASVGAAIARHDLTILQGGPETHTEMSHFLLCGPNQLHDLHSRLQLDHPNGTANQLHKCIVSHASGKGVFDGNVKVNRAAQKTDAGQLSRNLLLVPLATVNVKPNLQIIADDVKCTHGCAVSDLRDEELFYFRARGISADVARQALVFSFGSEVVQRMGRPGLAKRVQEDVARTLRSVEQFAGTS